MFELGRKSRLIENLAAQLVKTNDELLKQNKKFADAILATNDIQLERVKAELRSDPPAVPFQNNGFPRVDRMADNSMPDGYEVAFGGHPDTD